MGKGAGMGKYYNRKDGTNIGQDHVDRRYKAGRLQLESGDAESFKGTDQKEYKVTSTLGATVNVTAENAERARSKAGGGRILGSKEISRNKAQSAKETNVRRSRRNKRKK